MMAYNEQHLSLPEIGEHANQPIAVIISETIVWQTQSRAIMRFSNRGLVNGNGSIMILLKTSVLPYLCKCPEDRKDEIIG